MIIIDAYNAIHAWRNAPLREGGADVEALARLAAASPVARDEIHLVCDGIPPGGHDAPHEYRTGPIRITYAGAGKDADSLIEAIIQRSSSPSRLLVVSSDRRIQKAARRRRATAIESHRFIAMITAETSQPDQTLDDAKPDSLSPADVDAWLETFRLNEPAPPPSREAPPSAPSPPDDEMPPLSRDIDPDDLDMSKWIDAVDPLPPSEPRE